MPVTVGWISKETRLTSASLLSSACSVVLMFAADGESIHVGILRRLPTESRTETAPLPPLGLRMT